MRKRERKIKIEIIKIEIIIIISYIILLLRMTNNMICAYNFPCLPIELCSKIYGQVLNNRREESANTIIRYWFNYISKKIMAFKLMLGVTAKIVSVDYYFRYNILNELYFVLTYCVKYLTGRSEDKEWWLRQLDIIEGYLTFNHYQFSYTIEQSSMYLKTPKEKWSAVKKSHNQLLNLFLDAQDAQND